MSTVNVIVVGAGRAGAELHLPAYRADPRAVVSGICDPTLSLAEEVRAQHGLPAAYASLDEALRHNQVQVVSVCTPPQSHLRLAKQAMEQGCHVLLEKPMTVTLDEAKELLACQRRTGRKISVVHQNKFTPGIIRMQEIVRNGEAGDVLQVDMVWLSNGDKDRMIVDPGFWCHAVPGGRWAESLPHQLYVAYALVGRMRLLGVAARRRTSKWPWMAADEVNLVLESENGYVNLRMSANPIEKKRSLNVLHGTRQSFLFSYKMAIPISPYAISDRQKLRDALRVLRRGATTILAPKRRRRVEAEAPHALVIRRFLDHVLDDAPPPTTLDEAYHVMELGHEFAVAFEDVVGHAPST